MTAPRDATAYHAWLLRCWREVGDGLTWPAIWRCSLEDVHTGARHGFADPAAMMAFVQHILSGDPTDQGGTGNGLPC